jgi:hypothetical protein
MKENFLGKTSKEKAAREVETMPPDYHFITPRAWGTQDAEFSP